MKLLLLTISHTLVLTLGFALGVYFLPIIVAERGPSAAEVAAATSTPAAQRCEAQLRRDLKGSDTFHWGEGKITVTSNAIAHEGKLAPGPDYKLYLVPEFVDDEASFLKIKQQSLRVGEIKSYDGFIVNLPAGTDITRYKAVLIWCERFGEFISAASYR
jgi:hypothetical protein